MFRDVVGRALKRGAATDPSFPVKPGTVIDDKFRVEAVLGEGGMGVVVRALHLKLQSHVAIKFLLPEALADKTVVERFRREAQTAARLTGDNVARVLDVGSLKNGAPFMVMEYLQGETVSEALQRRTSLPIAEACGYMIQVCEALSEAHAMGIVHRDLKPGNLFLVSRPNKTVVKLLDFGISKLGGMSAPANMGELTMTTTVLGTPSFMAPEQLVSSRNVDARADIWSCGVVLFRMITGELPFDADSLIQLGVKLMNEDPPDLRKLRPDVPIALAAIVRRCLEREPHDRWATASDLGAALEPFALAGSASSLDEERPVTGSAPTLLAGAELLPPVSRPPKSIEEAPPSSDEEARVTVPKVPIAEPISLIKMPAVAAAASPYETQPLEGYVPQKKAALLLQAWPPQEETRVASPNANANANPAANANANANANLGLGHALMGARGGSPVSLHHAAFAIPHPPSGALRNSSPPASSKLSGWTGVGIAATAACLIGGTVLFAQSRIDRGSRPTTTGGVPVVSATPLPTSTLVTTPPIDSTNANPNINTGTSSTTTAKPRPTRRPLGPRPHGGGGGGNTPDER